MSRTRQLCKSSIDFLETGDYSNDFGSYNLKQGWNPHIFARCRGAARSVRIHQRSKSCSALVYRETLSWISRLPCCRSAHMMGISAAVQLVRAVCRRMASMQRTPARTAQLAAMGTTRTCGTRPKQTWLRVGPCKGTPIPQGVTTDRCRRIGYFTRTRAMRGAQGS